MRTGTFRSGLLLLAVAAVGLSGCLGGASAPTKFYSLAPMAGAPSGTSPAGPGRPLGIGPVTLPAYLDRPQIVTRRGGEELTLAEFDRWSEPLKTAVPRVLADNLAALLGTDRISVFPWGKAQAGQVQIIVDVTQFEAVADKEVVLGARWRILGSDGQELALRRSSLSETTGGPGYDAIVAAMSRVLGAMSREIAGAVQEVSRT